MSLKPKSFAISRPQFHSRLGEVMNYITWYGFKGQLRLAREAGVSRTVVSRIINGRTWPTYWVVCNIVKVLEHHLGRHLDPSDLISLDGNYPTKTVEELCGDRLGYFTGKTITSHMKEAQTPRTEDKGEPKREEL